MALAAEYVELHSDIVDKDEFLAWVETEHEDRYARCKQIAAWDISDAIETTGPLMEDWMEAIGKTAEDFSHLNSGDGFYQAALFEQWVQEEHPDLYEDIKVYDLLYGDEYGCSFVGALCEVNP